ncbi:hypothetical protein [Cellulomonas sp. ATA003]|uniref:hypothetical protein n=1 Tax=Cellulomonas sp. ATA003 TaxID=3073064 RepID=UPI002873C9BD|nr:hypothetical protein [Cellulomonas sp. ATA003]WNB86742.1 hypothetical protein REH70_05875 [Cellulomonas sp. ATA003]
MDEWTTARPARGRRGLGPGLTVFVVVDVLLVVAALVVLAAFLSGRGEPGTTVDPSPSVASTAPAPTDPGPTAPAPTAGPGTSADAGTFASPSGNIACEIGADAATCTIADSTAEPVTVEGCAGPVGQVVTVTAAGSETPCITGAIPGPAAPGTPVLDYGQSATVDDFTCESEESGMTCRHEPSGAGFTLARAGVELF